MFLCDADDKREWSWTRGKTEHGQEKGALGLHQEAESPGKGGRERVAASEGINSAYHDCI